MQQQLRVDSLQRSPTIQTRGGSSPSPIRRHKSPEPKILEAVDFFEAKCAVESSPKLSVRFTKGSKVSGSLSHRIRGS